MFITIAVIAYNEENTIKNILDDISRQDYDHNFMEVVLVDSASTDGTKAVMQKFADENKMGARQIVVLDNPKKTLPCGWNVLLDNYTGEAVIRVDAHAHIPEDFVSKNVKVLEEGEMVVGVNLPLRKITQTYKCGKEISYKSPWLVSEQCRLSTFPIRGLSYNDKSTKPTVFFIHKRKYVSSFH